MFKIGEFSKMCGLSIDTLYHYEEKKILVPSSVDNHTGYRFYDASQLVSVNKIVALKDAGFTLDEIAVLLKDEIPVGTLIEMLEAKAKSMGSTSYRNNLITVVSTSLHTSCPIFVLLLAGNNFMLHCLVSRKYWSSANVRYLVPHYMSKKFNNNYQYIFILTLFSYNTFKMN